MIERITCLIANITKWDISKYNDKVNFVILLRYLSISKISCIIANKKVWIFIKLNLD